MVDWWMGKRKSRGRKGGGREGILIRRENSTNLKFLDGPTRVTTAGSKWVTFMWPDVYGADVVVLVVVVVRGWAPL